LCQQYTIPLVLALCNLQMGLQRHLAIKPFLTVDDAGFEIVGQSGGLGFCEAEDGDFIGRDQHRDAATGWQREGWTGSEC